MQTHVLFTHMLSVSMVDSEICTWSMANISGVPLADFFALRGMGGDLDMKVAQEDIAEDVKNAAYKIIERKNATYYGIAMSVVRICRAILRDEKSILPVSTALHGEYGINDVSTQCSSNCWKKWC